MFHKGLPRHFSNPTGGPWSSPWANGNPAPAGTVPIAIPPGTTPGKLPGPLPGTPAAAAATSSLQTPLLIAGGFLVAAVAIVLLRPS